MTKLLAFHGKQEIKDFYIARVQAHYDADEIIKGKYWENGKGCAVGCTLHGSNHSDYEKELGISRIMARLEDGIFEGLPNQAAKEFPLKFLKAISVGADLSMVVPNFMHWLLVDSEHGIIKFSKNKPIIQNVADLYQRKINGEIVDINEWLSAKKAADAYAADAAAAYAYDADAYAAVAAAADAAYADAADADAAAAYAAAAYAAVAAAYDAAVAAAYAYAAADAAAAYAYASRQKVRTTQAIKLLELLSNAPVGNAQ